MKHEIPIETLGAAGARMAAAVEACVHCGFCLPTCPTYRELGEEMDSPRGRIVLMKGVLEGELALEQVIPHVDRCLGCLACVTACPSGVPYGELLNPFREAAEAQRGRPVLERIARWVTFATLPYPRRFRLAAQAATLAGPLSTLLPRRFRSMLDLLPRRLPPAGPPLPETYPAEGRRRARVALLAGCAQQVLAPQLNWATLRVLARNGVEVVVPRGQNCCGALSLHAGRADQARFLAAGNLDAFALDDVDAVVTNAAGCGSGMHEYPQLFEGTQSEGRASRFAEKVRDVSAFLAELGPIPATGLSRPTKVAYHDACHLAHAQGVRSAPRTLLAGIPGVTLLPIAESEICCGSAGTYNLEQPEIARSLGRRKAAAILATGADLVATGNIGCSNQIATHLAQLGSALTVMHTIEILDLAYGGGPSPHPNIHG